MIVVRSDKRHYRRADDLDVMSVSARDYLLVCRYNPPNQCIVRSAGNLATARQHTDIVDSLKND